MVKFSSLIAGLFTGAGGYAAYTNGPPDQGTLLNYVLGNPSWGNSFQKGSGQGNDAQVAELSKLVDRLSRDVRNQNGGVTVIHGSNGSSAIFTYGGVIVVSAMGIMWIRGWKFTDFLYVTRAALQKSMDTVNTSVEGLTQRMNSVKQIIGQQIDAVKQRQEAAMKKQEELKNRMDDVGMDVETTRTNVEEVHNDVLRLGGDVQALGAQQKYASEGIYLMCSVLGDILKTSNIRSGALPELHRYLGRSPSKGVPDLKTLLEGDDSGSTTNAQRLLPAASSPSEISDEKCDLSKPVRNKSGMLPRWRDWGIGPNGMPTISRQFSSGVS